MTSVPISSPRAGALRAWELGFNVTAIPEGGKEPDHQWNSKHAPWAVKRQPADVVASLPWRTRREVWKGREQLPITRFGIISGIADVRSIDIDGIPIGKDEQGNPIKQAVAPEIRTILLTALGLPTDYDWSGSSSSGKGLHLFVRCSGELPPDIANAKRATGESGVIVFVPIPAFAGTFDHIELRWAHCQTVLPKPYGYTHDTLDAPPADVSIDRLIAALRTIAAPKVKEPKAKLIKATELTNQGQIINAARTEQVQDVIGLFNERYIAAEILERNGYQPTGEGWEHPNTSQPGITGVKLVGDKIQSFSATDPLNNGHNHDAFSCFCILEHHHDTKSAVKAAAQALGLPFLQKVIGSELASSTAAPVAPGQGPVSTRIRTALTQAGYTFRLNELDSWVEVNGERLTDELEAEIIMAARDADVRPIEAVRPFIISEARRYPYHPIRDYLNSLVWDGGEHIDALCSHLTSSDSQVAYPGDEPLPLHQVYLYRWLIGAVAKVFEQAQNMTLVLAGPQNIGKSTLARWLCSGLGDTYFLEMPIDPHDKDSDLRQMRMFIWEIAELDATTRKADMSALKAFITRQAATVRKSYGRYDTTRPTVASFIGTVNKGEGFLSDTTGNRRFLVTTITSIDHHYTTIDVNQVWAQAVSLYRSGQPWRLQANEQQAQADANAEHEFDTPLEGWLITRFDTTAGPDYFLTSAEIIDHLRTHYDIRLSGSERGQAMEISRVCERLGLERRRLGRGQPYAYLGIRRKIPDETREPV